ncbi:uncharacterized protein [Magallana gigas]|uniref:uncharacterized protein n=1 Tax=Magallana gigas TaxID=29159 RepID=UPI003341D863
MAESSVVSDVKNMLKPELRPFLLARGITVTDYNVSQLRELAIKASEMKLPVISQKDDAIDSFRKRSTVALKDRVINFPFVCDVSLKSWTYDLSYMPDIVCADIFVHLLSNAQWTADRTKCYKQERGYRLFKCNHISAVQCHTLPEDHMYIRAKCLRETSQSEKPYFVWCLTDSNGTIKSAGCECTADDGGCKHVVALLFSLVEWSERHTDRNTATCTDVQCLWDKPRRESKPKKLDDISKSDINRVYPYTHIYHPIHEENVTDDDFEMEIFELVKNYDTQIIEVLDKDCTNNNNVNEPQPVPLLALSYRQSKCSMPFVKFMQESIDKSACMEIDTLTEGQSENVNWFKYRVGRVTASIVHDVVKYKGDNVHNSIVKKILTEKLDVSSPAILYGRERESLARELYDTQCKTDHCKHNVKIPGLLVNPKYPHIAASPDGVVTCDCCRKTLLEIKCPYKYRYCTVDQICRENYHIFLDSNNEMRLKHTSPWYYQIQCQLAVADLLYCDFVMYLEGVAACKHKIHVERIEFNAQFWAECLKSINSFYEKFVVPRLLSV